MSSFPVLDDEQWQQLLDHVAKHYQEVTLSRGFQYFKQQRVEALTVTDNRVVQARVTGSETYKVALHLDKLRSSNCTCPVQSFCKHQAAVMMELADRHGYLASQIVNARHRVNRIAAVSSREQALHQLPDMEASGWHEALDRYTAAIKPTYDLGTYLDLLRHQLERMRKADIPFPAVDRVFFELHQELFLLRKLKEAARTSVSSYTSFSVYRMYDVVQAWLRQKSDHVDIALSEARLGQTLRYMRERMAEETGDKYLDFGLYTALWKIWISPHGDAARWVTREIDELEKQSADSGSASLSAAKAYLYLRQSGSGDAWGALEAGGALKKAPVSLFLPYLDLLSSSSDWEGLEDWLVRIASFFHGQSSRELDAYMGYWKKAASHRPEAERQMWSVLEGMLPRSAPMIEDLLYEQRKWKPWVELQIVQGHDPSFHRVSVLQPIEKEAPQLLLPFYHQAIERHVALKNRHDYKAAVKLLKRLEKVYKKMKQPERWDRFFRGFMERHSRLRALQEEIRKGKLSE